MTAPEHLWPPGRAAEALSAAVGWLTPDGRPTSLANPGPDLRGAAEWARWVEAAAAHVGLIATPADVRVSRARALAAAGPTLVAVTAGGGDPDGFLLLLPPGRRGEIPVLAPDLAVAAVPEREIDGRLFGRGGEADRAIGAALAGAGLDTRTVAEATAVVGGGEPLSPGFEAWSLAVAQPRFGARLRSAGARALAATALGGHLAQIALFVVAWWLVGRGALEGRLETGWLWAWALVLGTLAAVQGIAAWAGQRLAITLAGLTRERLLEGILRQPAEEVRARGTGQLLGVVLEADALEAVARGGGPVALVSVVAVGFGAAVLARGAAPGLHLVLLAAWAAVAVGIAWRLHRRLVAWADARLALTDDLVEKMVGHRTVVAQELPDRRHRGEARALAAYERRAAALDAAMATVAALVPRGWLVAGVLGLGPAFATGAAPGPLAVSLGGVVIVYQALRRLADAVPAVAAAALAWRRTRPLFAAAAGAAPSPAALVASVRDDHGAAGTRGLLVGRHVTYAYPGRAEPVLRGVSFAIRRGARVLLGGASGAGKSTLAALVAGLRQPDAGVLLLGGFDHHSLGPDRWRQRSAGVPQFHENHVLSATLLFNVLMGRRWPPRAEDVREAEVVCRALGLGPLLERMPAGLQQMVGDTGWQLSHGERSRVFVARSLLQRLEVRILDESFASLDPHTALTVLDAVIDRSETLVVVHHG